MTPDLLPERIAKRITVDANGCWIWRGTLTRDGYGKARVGSSMVRLHRFTYESLLGSIPDGLHIDHLCRVRSCCNPLHLEPVTNRVNVLRGDTIPAAHAAASHCKRGHEFTEGNTYRYVSKYGYPARACRACRGLAAIERQSA